MLANLLLAAVCSLAAGPGSTASLAPATLEISGRYPHLAVSSQQGECGIGAVVPWAGRLWYITYGPHLPEGSDDKLYELDRDLTPVTRPESVGGTPANRMIHRESNQLSIGPYFIDADRNVRVIPPSRMYGRLTATARHLTDPARKVYICDMEGLIYEVDVHSLEARLLFRRPVPGWHGKGGYSGQGRLVLGYNGEHPTSTVDRFQPFDAFLDPTPHGPEDAGSLSEWDGKQWRLVERRQFTDVTGPGGIHGPRTGDAPLWALGWDRRSLLLKLLDHGEWSTFRLPTPDFSYLGTHGWHTEWPRIREVTGGKFLMNLHGGWFDFPPTFAAGRTSGLRPLGDYLKITADFCAWDGRIVFGCDDTAKSGFAGTGVGDTLNRLNGRSNSNLWFTTWEGLSRAGRPAGNGGPWLGDAVQAATPSTPFLLAGYDQRTLHLSHDADTAVVFTLEIDRLGDGRWTPYQTVTVAPHGATFHVFSPTLEGEWIRLTADHEAPRVTAYFRYGPGGGTVTDRNLFAALADVDHPAPWTTAVLRSEGDPALSLGVLSRAIDGAGTLGPARTYQVDAALQFRPTPPESESARFLEQNAAVTEPVLESDENSILVREGPLRFRLPRGLPEYHAPWPGGSPRVLREVVTERALLNAGGSFYVLPRTNSGGLRRIKPVCTHNKKIADFCSWRGLLVLAGCTADAAPSDHAHGPAGAPLRLWFGDIDDLWKLGKPVGDGGPWHGSTVAADEPSDPYLMAGYDRKSLELTNHDDREAQVRIEVDVAADGTWTPYTTLTIPAGQTATHAFPDGYSAHWVRLRSNRAGTFTATFAYD